MILHTNVILSIYRGVVYYINLLFFYIYNILSSISAPLSTLSLIDIYIIVSVFILGVFAYIKLKYPFWSIQPCWHTYDYWRYLYKTPFVIQKSKPGKTKYLKHSNVITMHYLDASEETLKECINMLQCFYIPSDKILLTIGKPDLNAIMTGHEGSPYLSIYTDKKYQIDLSNSELPIIATDKPIACMISYPICIYYKHKPSSNTSYTKLNVHYWDYLCIHRNHKNSDFLRNLIQTHEYNQRYKSPEMPVSFFKKEVSLCQGIIPLIKYKSYTYYLQPVRMTPLPEHCVIVRIVKENISLLFDFLVNLQNPEFPALFQVYAYPCISNIQVLIESEQLYVYCLKQKQHIYGMYFMKKTYMTYEDLNNGNALQLVASIHNSNLSSIFVNGFMHAFSDLLKNSVDKYHVLIIDDCSHNWMLLPEWNRMFTPLFENISAYYFYNFVYTGSPLLAKDTFILL
jgi:hypothetical protein